MIAEQRSVQIDPGVFLHAVQLDENSFAAQFLADHDPFAVRPSRSTSKSLRVRGEFDIGMDVAPVVSVGHPGMGATLWPAMSRRRSPVMPGAASSFPEGNGEVQSRSIVRSVRPARAGSVRA